MPPPAISFNKDTSNQAGRGDEDPPKAKRERKREEESGKSDYYEWKLSHFIAAESEIVSKALVSHH